MELPEQYKLDLLNARLSDSEKEYLFQFCQNEAMVLAVEKVMLYSLYEMGTLKQGDEKILDVNWAFVPHNTNTTDEMLGRDLRAKIAGLSFMEDAFNQVRKFGIKAVAEGEVLNPAL